MRTFFDIDRPTCRDRLAARRVELHQHLKPTRICRFEGHHLWLGHATQHRTPAARKLRTRLRIKRLISKVRP